MPLTCCSWLMLHWDLFTKAEDPWNCFTLVMDTWDGFLPPGQTDDVSDQSRLGQPGSVEALKHRNLHGGFDGCVR
ncbi:hypothetical protein EYF80_035123 [Liparis tanakae]|uniref:Uncharacterized protein n=1 Tax=Liparis tanakae TaxID=230148 RepID=A0A4Z2GPM0_9TELE|nr:hypothetical protein EYF80_035123 [Liparis tanakae]